MGLVEEEYQFRQREVSHLRQIGIELSHKPKQIGGVEFRIEHQLVGCKDVHYSLSVLGVEQVVDIECRLPEELLPSLVLDSEQCALDGSDAGGGDVSVLSGELGGIPAHEVQHQAEVLEVDEQEVLVVRYAENDVEHSGLGLVQVHEAGQQLGSHCRYCGAHRVALLSEDVEETGRAACELGILYAEFRTAFFDEG